MADPLNSTLSHLMQVVYGEDCVQASQKCKITHALDQGKLWVENLQTIVLV